MRKIYEPMMENGEWRIRYKPNYKRKRYSKIHKIIKATMAGSLRAHGGGNRIPLKVHKAKIY